MRDRTHLLERFELGARFDTTCGESLARVGLFGRDLELGDSSTADLLTAVWSVTMRSANFFICVSGLLDRELACIDIDLIGGDDDRGDLRIGQRSCGLRGRRFGSGRCRSLLRNGGCRWWRRRIGLLFFLQPTVTRPAVASASTNKRALIMFNGERTVPERDNQKRSPLR